MALIVVYPVCGQDAFYDFAFDVEAEAVTAVVTDLSELSLEPSGGDEVFCQWSVVLEVLFFVVFDLLCKVLV